MMKKKPSKSFFDLTPAERDKEVAQFDREMDLSKTKPLTKKQRLLHEKALGQATKTVYAFELDPALMNEARRVARRRGMSLDKFVEVGVKGMVAFSGR